MSRIGETQLGKVMTGLNSVIRTLLQHPSSKTTAFVTCDTRQIHREPKPQFPLKTPPYNTSTEISPTTQHPYLTVLDHSNHASTKFILYLFIIYFLHNRKRNNLSCLHNAVTITSPLKVSQIYKLRTPWWEGECSQFKL